MKQLTQSEIGRTAFPWKDPSNFTSTFGRTHPLRDPNEMCIYCKNENTDRVLDQALLKPFLDFYKEAKFKAFHCSACESVFSVYYKGN
jgi:hypothetical protein